MEKISSLFEAPKNIFSWQYFPGGGWPRQLQMTVVWGETRYSGGPGGRPRRAAAQSGRAVSLTLTLAAAPPNQTAEFLPGRGAGSGRGGGAAPALKA